MTWERPVFSSMVQAIGYDADLNAMIVRWNKNTKVSAYLGVPEEKALEVSRAPSVGQIINTEIKPYYEHRYINV